MSTNPTPRELQVMKLVAEGQSNKCIASELGLSVRTVEEHRWKMMRRLGLRSTADVVRYAIRNQIVEA